MPNEPPLPPFAKSALSGVSDEADFSTFPDFENSALFGVALPALGFTALLGMEFASNAVDSPIAEQNRLDAGSRVSFGKGNGFS